jgi:hypothetical protein
LVIVGATNVMRPKSIFQTSFEEILRRGWLICYHPRRVHTRGWIDGLFQPLTASQGKEKFSPPSAAMPFSDPGLQSGADDAMKRL